jgi:hypothetical protein
MPMPLEGSWRRRLSADAQVRALPSQKCQRRRLDAGLDSFR